MVDFITEVEEELRKDQYNRLLRRYGPYLVALIILIVSLAIFLEWRAYSSARQSRAVALTYMQTVDLVAEGDVDQAISDFIAIAQKASDGYGGLALMRAGALAFEKGDNLQAYELYNQAAEHFTSLRHRQLALLKAGYILLADEAYDEVIARMEPLAKIDQPYEFLARELRGLAAMETGDQALARQEFAYLEAIPGVGSNIRTRAQQNLNALKFLPSVVSEPTTEDSSAGLAAESEDNLTPVESLSDE